MTQAKYYCADEVALTGDQLKQIVEAALELEEFEDTSKDFRNELQ